MKNEISNIIKAAQQGQRSAQKKLYEHTYTNLLNCVLIYSKDLNDAQWLFNMGMMKVFGSIEKFELGTNYEAWASVILIRSCIDYFRKNKKYNETLVPVVIEDYNDKAIDVNNAINNLETGAIIELVQQLPEKERIVFSMYEIDGYSHVEISEMVGINKNTSKWLLAKSKKALRQKLNAVYNLKNSINE